MFKEVKVAGWLEVALTVIGVVLLAVLVWFAAPLVEVGGLRPLGGAGVRVGLILLILAIVLLAAAFRIYRRRAAAQALERAMLDRQDGESDAEALHSAMQDALATLRGAKGAGRNYLYQIPWYMIIGRPGSGKTTVLANSGLRFPLNPGGTPSAVAGLGTTRYCDWWFTDDAVLIDTAGRYTTQDSSPQTDAAGWLGFLDLLKRNRPQQPINGVLVALSLEDLLTLDREGLQTYAAAVRRRLVELHQTLGVDFPIYVLLTKADLVAGFREAFADLNEPERRAVWGATFRSEDKSRNMVAEAPAEYDALIERLNAQMPDRLQAEPNPAARVRLFGLPSQLAALKPRVMDFLNLVFEPTRFHAKAMLRGFYFTSGTQKGTPFDQLISAMASNIPAGEAAPTYSNLGKSFFIADLLEKVVFPEAGWVSTNRGAIRRSAALNTATLAGLAVLALAIAALWWSSYGRNAGLVAATRSALADYRGVAQPMLGETVVADRDFARVLPLLHKLRYLPAGYADRDRPVPLAARFGLSQAGRLRSSAEALYDTGLERMLRPRLLFRLEEQLDANRNNPAFLYDALKVYLMLGGQVKVDKGLIEAWMRRDWADTLFPGPANASGRLALEQHLAAMLDMDGLPVVSLNGPLVEDTQRTLARLSVAERAFQILRAQAGISSQLDWSAARGGGPDAGLVFEAVGGQDLDSVRVPYFYTYDGFQHAFIDKLAEAGEQVARDQWVLGAVGEQSAVQAQYATLYRDLSRLYTQGFIDAWQKALGRLKLRSLTADKPKYVALAAAAAPTSPIKQIFESIRDETELTRDRAPPGAAAAQAAQKGGRAAQIVADLSAKALNALPVAGGAAAAPTPANLSPDDVPGAAIEAKFKPFQVVVEGEPGRRPIDALLQALGDIAQTLAIAAANPSQAAQANAALVPQVASLRGDASRLPAPFSDMLRGAADEFEGDVSSASARQLAQALADQVTRVCQQIVTDRYPFVKSSERDVGMGDFGRLFAPNGIMDQFFARSLANLVDQSQPQWAPRPDSRLGRSLSASTLLAFQQAASIRDAFFPTGGNVPAVSLTVTPLTLSGDANSAKLEIGATTVTSERGSNTPVALTWPGAGAERTAITLDLGFFSKAVSMERAGPWSLFRMLDAASVLNQGDKVVASFVIEGKEVSYQFAAAATANPLTLPALREFKCPTGL